MTLLDKTHITSQHTPHTNYISGKDNSHTLTRYSFVYPKDIPFP